VKGGHRYTLSIVAALCCTTLTPPADAAIRPPLPAWKIASDADWRYSVPPLPSGSVQVSNDWMANPFDGGDAAASPDSRVSADPVAGLPGSPVISRSDPLLDEAGGRDAPLPESAPVDARPGSARQTAAGAAEPLEGPPTPLPALPRLAATAAGPGGVADDGLPPDRPITLNFQRAELSAVLHAFAQFTKLNIVASERVRGQVTLRLDRVPWRTAFDLLLEVNGLAMERHGAVIWVTPAADLAARERQRFEAHARTAELEPLASRAFELHYAHAEDLRRLLAGSGNQRALSKRGGAVADARTNLLFVTDLPARLDEIAALVAKLDRPTRQVLIEARIVEGDRGLSQELGVRLGVSPTGDGTARGLHGGTDGTVYDLSAGPVSGFGAAQLGLSLLAARATRLLDVELSALEADGRGRVVSSPRVVTAERTKAIVEQGTELPYQAKVAQGVSGVQFRRASLKLEVEPQITPDGRVILDLDVAKDSVGEETAAGPAINTKHVQTRVEIEDGGTVSIGGIDATDDREDVTRVPVLGKIPVLGALFSHRQHRDQRSELVVFITPRVVTND
jgi:type IV pilus assembly protein PilQ